MGWEHLGISVWLKKKSQFEAKLNQQLKYENVIENDFLKYIGCSLQYDEFQISGKLQFLKVMSLFNMCISSPKTNPA